jgi:CheY-like chemotaxis protein
MSREDSVTHQGNFETILLVEDDPLVREHAETVLRSLGYQVVTAGNGPEALQVAEQTPLIDLLFTDMVMPGGMTGRDLAERLMGDRPGLAVLYTSGYAENAFPSAERARESALLLNKPYRREELARKVREALIAPR